MYVCVFFAGFFNQNFDVLSMYGVHTFKNLFSLSLARQNGWARY